MKLMTETGFGDFSDYQTPFQPTLLYTLDIADPKGIIYSYKSSVFVSTDRTELIFFATTNSKTGAEQEVIDNL
jgi:hypothetical protein